MIENGSGSELLGARDVMAFCSVGRTAAYAIMASIPERIRVPGGFRVRRRDLERYIEHLIESQQEEVAASL
jgi:hypothetical protein